MVSSNKFNLKLMKINGLVGFAYFGYAFKEKMVEKQWKQRMSLFQTWVWYYNCEIQHNKFPIQYFFSYVRVMRYSTYSRTVFKIYKKQACKLRVSERWILHFNPSKLLDWKRGKNRIQARAFWSEVYILLKRIL